MAAAYAGAKYMNKSEGNHAESLWSKQTQETKTMSAPKLNLNLTPADLKRMEDKKDKRIVAARHSWKKVGNIAHEYIYQDRNAFGNGDTQVPAELLAMLMVASGRYETADSKRMLISKENENEDAEIAFYRLKDGQDAFEISELGDLYAQYQDQIEALKAEPETKPGKTKPAK